MLTTVPLFNQRTIKIKRRQKGAYLDHRYKEGGVIGSDLIGTVQPATLKELRSKPEGEEFTSGIKVFTNDTKGIKGTDILEDGAEQFRVISVLPWQHHGYYKVIAGLIDA